MRIWTEKEYNRQLDEVKKLNIQKEYRRNLKDEHDKYSRKLKVETSKLIAIYLFLLLNAIVIFAMVAMWNFADLTYLGVLISDIAAQVLIYAIYCMKAFKAKESEEELKFRKEQHKDSLMNIISAAAESEEYVPTTIGEIEPFAVQVDESQEEDGVG